MSSLHICTKSTINPLHVFKWYLFAFSYQYSTAASTTHTAANTYTHSRMSMRHASPIATTWNPPSLFLPSSGRVVLRCLHVSCGRVKFMTSVFSPKDINGGSEGKPPCSSQSRLPDSVQDTPRSHFKRNVTLFGLPWQQRARQFCALLQERWKDAHLDIIRKHAFSFPYA